MRAGGNVSTLLLLCVYERISEADYIHDMTAASIRALHRAKSNFRAILEAGAFFEDYSVVYVRDAQCMVKVL